jgi:hypothetical protein
MAMYDSHIKQAPLLCLCLLALWDMSGISFRTIHVQRALLKMHVGALHFTTTVAVNADLFPKPLNASLLETWMMTTACITPVSCKRRLCLCVALVALLNGKIPRKFQ